MTRKNWMIVLGTATVVLTVVGVLLERPMEHAGAPGILAFEFAATKVRVSQLLAEWGPAGRHAARVSLIVDYGLCRHRHKPYYPEFVIMPTCLPNPALEAVIHR